MQTRNINIRDLGPIRALLAYTQQDRPSGGIATLVLTAIVVPLFISRGLNSLNAELMVSVACLLISAFVALRNPYAGLLIFTATLYLRLEETIPAIAGVHLSLVTGLSTGLGLYLTLVQRKIQIQNTPLIWMMVGFWITGLVSGSLHGEFSSTALDFSRLLMIAVLLTNLLRSEEQYRGFVTLLIIANVYVGAFSIYSYYNGMVTIDQGLARARSTGIFSDPNDLSAMLTSGLAFIVMRTTAQSGLNRVLYIICSIVVLFAIFLAGSRGGLIALSILLLACTWTLSKRKVLSLCLVLTVVGIIAAAAPGHMTDFDSQEESANSRFQSWDEGLSSLRVNPIIGIGYKQFQERNGGLVAHNSYVQCFAELGFVGFVFWFGCIYFAYKKQITTNAAANTQRQKYDLIGARLALAAYLTASFFITRTYQAEHCILVCLPLSQQIAEAGGNKLKFIREGDLRKTGLIIIGWCITIIVVVNIVVGRLK